MEKSNLFEKYPEHSVLNKQRFALKGAKYFLPVPKLSLTHGGSPSNLPHGGREIISTPSSYTVSSEGRVRKGWEVLLKVTTQGPRLMKRLRHNHRTSECFSSPTYYHITKGPFIAVFFFSPVHQVWLSTQNYGAYQ